MKLRELWQQLKHPRGLRVIHGLPKGLSQQEPPAYAELREKQRAWLAARGITQAKPLIAVKP